MRYKALHIGFMLVALSIGSCVREATPEEIEAYMAQQLERRIERIKLKKRIDCIRAIQADATMYVDSIILGEFQVDLLDSIEMIEKPFKPQRPAYIKDIDTSKVKPMF